MVIANLRVGLRINESWIPPRSDDPLIQEDLHRDPWRLLVACICLNQTTREQLDKVIWKLFQQFPEPQLMAEAEESQIASIIKSLGFQNRRSQILKKMSQQYISVQWQTAKELTGCGKYADDSYQIFCLGNWRAVQPQDHALVRYHKFLEQLYDSKR